MYRSLQSQRNDSLAQQVPMLKLNKRRKVFLSFRFVFGHTQHPNCRQQIRAQFFTDNKGNLVNSWYRCADDNPTEDPHSEARAERC